MNRIREVRRGLVKYGKKIAREGFVVGLGGNISSSLGEKVYLKASGVFLAA